MEKQNILIIDDEPAITQSLRRSLRDNFEVFTANTVTQAMEILQQHEIAVIITDQRMPDMQGVDFLKSAHLVQPNSLSLLLSGYSDIQALVAALNVSTVRGFIPKPWDNQELLQKIDDTVKEYRAVIKNPQMLKESTAAVAELQAQVDDLKHMIDTITLGSDPQKPSADAANKQQADMDSENRSIESIYATSTGVSARLLGLLHLREANPAKFEELKER
jgi:response regulator RpfG family c-di-GMP phosphodiesterase